MNTGGKTGLVSGGASGLGRATVEGLHAAGMNVVVADLPGSEGQSLAERLGHRAAFSPTDVTDEAQVQAAVDLARERFGALHVSVSCAGIGRAGRVLGRGGPLPLGDFAQVININLVGTFNLVRLAAAAMLENEPDEGERGVLINTASIAAFDGQVGQPAYAASKGGVVALTLPVARELASKQIRCMTIAPGTFETPMLAGLPDEATRALAAAIPHPNRLGRPAEFAALVVHIIENPMLNGEVIRLDGALRMAPR
ncbi:MAG: 3-hydroxyacyl-CoA dehydrogenase [Candidatus Dormibacteria bacterium]